MEASPPSHKGEVAADGEADNGEHDAEKESGGEGLAQDAAGRRQVVGADFMGHLH